MADRAGQIDLRSINVDKAIKGFAEEANIMKEFVTVKSMDSREIRWYQKTAGFLDTLDSTAITASQIDFVAPGGMPEQAGNTFTRNTAYAKKFMLRSRLISEEDIKDNDVDLFQQELRDITRAVARRVDNRIWDILTESRSVVNINSTTTTSVGGDQWDAASGLNPVADVYDALRQIAANSYDISTAVLMVSPKDYASLAVYVYNKGAQGPQHGDDAISGKKLMTFAGCRVVVSNNVTADYAAVFIPEKAVTWYSFMPITGAVVTFEGIGREIRVWEEGEAVLTDPKACTLIIDTQT